VLRESQSDCFMGGRRSLSAPSCSPHAPAHGSAPLPRHREATRRLPDGGYIHAHGYCQEGAVGAFGCVCTDTDTDTDTEGNGEHA